MPETPCAPTAPAAGKGSPQSLLQPRVPPLLPIPHSLGLWRTAHPSPCSFPAASLHLAAPSRFGTQMEERGHHGAGSAPPGQEQQPQWSRAELHQTAQYRLKQCSTCPILSSRVSTNHGWWFATTLCPERKCSQSLRLPLSPPSSPWPILTGTDVPSYSNASTAKERLVLNQHPPPPWQAAGSWGSPWPATPGCFHPRDVRQQRGRQGQEQEGGGGSCCCPGFPRIKYEQPCCVILNC